MPPLELSPGGRRYGYFKDVPDHRDLGVGRAPFIAAVSATASLLSLLGPVLDQGQEGSCTAHAGCADREFTHWKQRKQVGGPVTPGEDGLYSPAFLYYIERQLDGTLDQGDCGSYGRTSCQALAAFGVALRADMPYTPGDFSTAPSTAQLAGALDWKSGGYHRLATVDDMKSCIASGYCFRVGFTVFESFESIDSSGVWSPSPDNESVLGGHEVLAFGFDDTVNGGSFQIRNSWGAGWGASGNFWMRYQDAADSNVLLDAWIQHLGKW